MISRPVLRYAVVTTAILSYAAAPVFAQNRDRHDGDMDSSQTRDGSFLPLPFVFHTPETGTAFGITASIVYRPRGADSGTRPSAAQPVVAYTTKKQLILSVENETYLAGNRLRVYGNAAYLKFPTTFWGIGNETPDSNEEDYTPRILLGWFEVQRQLRPGFYAGGVLQLTRRNLLDVASGGLLDSGVIPGSVDGTVVSLGLVGTYDKRDNIVFPRSGFYSEIRLGMSDNAVASDYDFKSLSIDVRGYKRLGSRASVAVRGTSQSVSGTAPFDLLPQLGGEEQMRGYFSGRYRDRHMVVAQVEFRTQVWRRIGMVGFYEVGQVATAVSDLSVNRFKNSYGGGLRFLFDRDEGLNLRFDWGFASGSSGFYMGIGEVF